MKKLLFGLFLGCVFLSSPSVAAVTEGSNILRMTEASDATTSSWKIHTITWVSAASNEIAATDGFSLTNTAGEVIILNEATAAEFGYTITFPEPIIVSGVIALALDSGELFIYGQRR